MFKKRAQLDPGMRKVHTHNPVVIEFNATIKYAITEDGIVKIQVTDPATQEYDEVAIPAYLIFKIGDMLNNTRKSVKLVPRETPDETKNV